MGRCTESESSSSIQRKIIGQKLKIGNALNQERDNVLPDTPGLAKNTNIQEFLNWEMSYLTEN